MFPKKELTFVLQYLVIISLDLGKRLRKNIGRNLPYCKLKRNFRSKFGFIILFRFKD